MAAGSRLQQFVQDHKHSQPGKQQIFVFLIGDRSHSSSCYNVNLTKTWSLAKSCAEVGPCLSTKETGGHIHKSGSDRN